MKKGLVLVATLACVALFVGGCSKGFNIFTPFSPAAGSLPASTENAANAYAAGDYAAAMAMYLDVLNQTGGAASSPNSSARYGYVKAYVKEAGFDIASFITTGTGMGSGAPAAFAPVKNSISNKAAMLDDQQNPFGINAATMEALSQVIITFLGPIAAGGCDGVIAANDPGLNTSLAFAYLLKGIFLVIDPDNNGTVDYNIYDDGNGNVDIVYWGTTNVVPQEAFSANQAAATECLNNAIARLDVAISGDTGSIWTDVRNFLLEVKSGITGI